MDEVLGTSFSYIRFSIFRFSYMANAVKIGYKVKIREKMTYFINNAKPVAECSIGN